MKPTSLLLSIIAAGFLVPNAVHAGALEVSPVNIEVVAPMAATIVHVRNVSKSPMTTQLRVFRWSQVDGIEHLEPSNDVVVSPPMATLVPGAEQTVRLIRANGPRTQAEESFRLIVDELPNASTPRSGTVAIVVRHSLPVFFRPSTDDRPNLSWKLENKNGREGLVARNSGQRRVRIAALSVRDETGQTVHVAPGLAGYVLAGSTMRFELPAAARKLSRKSLSILAQGDVGPINVVLSKTGN